MTTSTITLKSFVTIIGNNPVVGMPSNLKINEIEEFVSTMESVECEIGQKGESLARCYWADGDTGEITEDGLPIWSAGGCISILTNEIDFFTDMVRDMEASYELTMGGLGEFPSRNNEHMNQFLKRADSVSVDVSMGGSIIKATWEIGNNVACATIMRKELPDFTADDAIIEINSIIKAVESQWLDNCGGLTMAGSDIVGLGKSMIYRIKKCDYNWAWEAEEGGYSTGEESAILQAGWEWAKPYVWSAWRKAAKAYKDETPRQLVMRRIEEGMSLALYKIPCPPDRSMDNYRGDCWIKEIKEIKGLNR